MGILRRASNSLGDASGSAPKEARTYSLMGIPDGPEGIRVTLSFMVKLVKIARISPQIRDLAESIIANVEEKHDSQEVDALRQWVRGNIRYTADPNDVETLQSPAVLLETRQGDCDDQATLFSALAQSVGYRTRFAAVAFAPDQFEHVYSEVLLGTRWIAAETTENVALGWYPPKITSRITANV